MRFNAAVVLLAAELRPSSEDAFVDRDTTQVDGSVHELRLAPQQHHTKQIELHNGPELTGQKLARPPSKTLPCPLFILCSATIQSLKNKCH